MTCTENSEIRLPKLKNIIKDQLIQAELRCRSTSVHQSNSFQDDKTFEEIIGKEPWTLRNYRSSWTSILPGPVLLVPSVFRFKTSYVTIIRLKRNYMEGQKIDYSKVPSGSGVFAPIPDPPVLGDHSGIGVLANSPTSASDSPGNSPTRP